MTNNKILLSCILFLTVAFSAVVANGQDAEGKDALKARLDRHYAIRGEMQNRMDPNDIPQGGGRYGMQICWGRYTVDFVYAIGDPHLVLQEDFIIMGPFSWLNMYIVRPISADRGGKWNHSWKFGTYIATPNADPGWYDIESVGVKPHLGEEERNHTYLMYPSGWNDDGCPTYFDFHSHGHEGEDPGRHPGHAGASID